MLPTIQHLSPAPVPAETTEQFRTLLQTRSFRLEQIVSHGQSSPEDFWYDQSETEWVALFRGKAVLEFEDDEMLSLKAGDALVIAPHRKHRVKFCSHDAIWLALHFSDPL